ncbi:TlpA family protein disulfide reductase [Microbacterium koreense]|uniref:TlpA family protein disulfide reductase n=1 Tax=Microbacterium koreense TaxID=323761 RepID=A0ABW2ZTM6_9MICO
MDFVGALITIAALLVLTIGIGFVMRRLESRPRRHIPHEVVEPHRLGAEALGDAATLLQFSTEMCARCPGVHRTLASLAAEHDGVRHLDIDVTDRPDIARHFHVMQTPTTLILDRHGAVQTRFGGAPSRHVVDLELRRLTGTPERV